VRRLLAVIGALGMVAAALAARQAIEGDEEADTGDEQIVVVCDADLARACDALEGVEVRREDSAVTSAAIDGGDLDDVDAWVTSAAWLEVTESRAERSIGEAVVLAGSPVVLAADAVRADALQALCGGTAA